jgi:hypothetical protein
MPCCLQGKYKTTIAKVQAIADFQGRPMFYSGPHVGVRSDIRLWRQHGPDMGPHYVFGDKAYQGDPHVLSPIKNRRHSALSQAEEDYNKCLSWFRAGVEHMFSQVVTVSVASGVCSCLFMAVLGF